VLAAALPAEERRAYHARLARAAERIGLDDPEFLANHFERAQLLAAAAPYAEQAGDRARAAMALERARELYTRALQGRAPERPASLVAKLADVAAAACDLQLAAPLFLEAAAAQPEQGWRLRQRAAEIYLLRGAEAEAMALLRPVLREAGIPVPSSMNRAVLISLLSLARCALTPARTPACDAGEDVEAEVAFRIGYMLMLHDVKGVALILWSAARARRHGSAPQQGRALAALAHVYSLLGLRTPAQQDQMLERGLVLTRAQPLDHATVLVCKALVAWGRCQCDVALATLDHVSALITQQRLDAQWMLGHIDSLVGSAAVLAGDFQRIHSFAAGAERDALEQGNRPVVAQIQSWRAWASLAGGDPTAMQRYAAAARREWDGPRLTPLYGIAVWGEGHRLLYLGQTADACDLMRREAPRFARAGLMRSQMWRIALTQLWGNVELACSQRPGDAHYRAAERHARQLRREPILWGRASGALLDAGLAQRAGDAERAELHYREAMCGFAALGMRGCEAVAAYRRRELTGELPRSTDDLAWFTAQRVAEPERWVRTLAP
jgi:hypothetical protein